MNLTDLRGSFGSICVAVLALVCGCSGSRVSSRPALTYAVESNDGAFYVTYQPLPDPIPLNEPFALVVVVFQDPEHRKAAADVSLEVDAAMPQHRHGMTLEPQVEAHGAGSFTVQGMLFHMPGRWELYFDITQGPVTERAQLDVKLE
ncbi:MAG: hypothetical protein V3T77_02410 [Planctomycetota bacterium]